MTMSILTGLLIINGKDIYTEFGAFLAEDAQDKHTNYDALLEMPRLKEQPEVSIREENGVRTPNVLTQCFEPRDIVLQFAIEANNKTEFLRRYIAFIRFLKQGDNGWLTIRLTDLNLEFRVRMTESSGYTQLTPFAGNSVAAIFKIRFREPVPAFEPIPATD